MQDCCIGTYMARWFAASISPSPISSISHHVIPLQASHPHCPSSNAPASPQDASLPVSMCSHCSIPTYEWEHAVFDFLFISLLRMMVSRFIHVPTKDTSSSFFMAAKYYMVYMCHIFLVQSIIDGHLGWLQVFATVHSAAVNICVHVSL